MRIVWRWQEPYPRVSEE
ncbi:hypothetical protein AGR6A_Lc90164 [Agrobacterium sp. NCPPB 925]|nr:hypothetical protein AGR6A_Lc90164 [Agrobacterium sp. NCPPB 925]